MNAFAISASVPSSSSSLWLTCFAVPFVAIGMKNGVFTIPCFVFKVPVLASLSWVINLNMSLGI